MSFTRTPEQGARKDTVRPRFHIEAVQDEAASHASGHPMFKDEERVQHLVPGSFNSFVERVNDAHKLRWPAEYAAFKAGITMSAVGTPIEQWSILTRSQVAELKAQDFHTVEQCAEMNDEVLSRARSMGMRGIRNAAKAYLDDAEGMKITTELTRLNELLETRNAELENQLKVQATAIERMQADILRMGSSLSGAQTYIPAQHDPVERARMMSPAPMLQGASSLDDFVAPKRRGRPPMQRDEIAA